MVDALFNVIWGHLAGLGLELERFEQDLDHPMWLVICTFFC